MLNKVKFGLAIGIFLGFMHLVWAIGVLIGIVKPFMDWVLAMHFIGFVYTITSFNALNALILIVLTFIFGFIYGWIIALVWNWLNKSK